MVTFRKIDKDLFMVGIKDIGEMSFHSIEAARKAYDLLKGQETVRGKASLESVRDIESVI